MPCYNVEKYVHTAIKSILNQTYKNFEFLILDDGSTDKTKNIIKSIDDERIILFECDLNQGLVKQLNKGISAAKGEYIARMDADDWAHPDRLTIQVNYLLKNPDVGVCGTDINLWDGNKIKGTWKFPISDQEIKTRLFFKCPFAHPSVIYRKSLFNNNAEVYNSSYFPAEDYELWLRLKTKTSFHNINKTLLKYRISPNSISNTQSDKQSEKAFEISWLQVLSFDIPKDILELYFSTHKSFIIGPWPDNKHDLIKLITWLEILIEVNEYKKQLAPAKFNLMLAEKLWKICYFLSYKKINSISLYRQSKLKGFYSPPILEQMLSCIKND